MNKYEWHHSFRIKRYVENQGCFPAFSVGFILKLSFILWICLKHYYCMQLKHDIYLLHPFLPAFFLVIIFSYMGVVLCLLFSSSTIITEVWRSEIDSIPNVLTPQIFISEHGKFYFHCLFLMIDIFYQAWLQDFS